MTVLERNGRKPAQLGILGSSGGSALDAAVRCLSSAGRHPRFVVVTDRECGLERVASDRGLTLHRIAGTNTETLSQAADTLFAASGCEDVLLFYTRRVAMPLIGSRRVWNIHPSLLPGYRGLGAVRQAHEARSLLIGATLHRVDEDLDTGPIHAQVVALAPRGNALPSWERISYVQKVWLTLVWFEQVALGKTADPFRGPLTSPVGLSTGGLTDTALQAAFERWLGTL